MRDVALIKQMADTIRMLSAEAIEKAGSGHPGLPMGCADFASVLWHKYLRHNPADPEWLGRDRFILSAGHGSMLLYSLLHLYDYGLSMEELKSFRQWGSLTPGHPEFGHTKGVEVTTGPLASGFATGVGMALANKHISAKTGFEKSALLDNKYFILSSDGGMMEGTSHEAASLAGHLELDNIVCFYDDNSISIEGSTELAFSDETAARFRAYNWRVIELDDANNIEKVDKALAEAVESDGRPTIIIGKTKIGYGSPNKEGTESAHGAPLGEDEIEATRKNLGLETAPFTVPEDVKEMLKVRITELKAEADKWLSEFDKFTQENKDAKNKLDSILNPDIPENLCNELIKSAPIEKAMATRASAGKILQKAAELVPALYGGAADLAPSTKSNISDAASFSSENRSGVNFHFGVRELGMGFCGNGMSLYGGIPYTSTFFVFADYMKPALRLAAIQNLKEIYIFTHDSFYVGEDGPTHQPIEQLSMLRAIPGLTLIRPAEAREAAHAWAAAINNEGPTALALTRQGLEPIPEELASNIQVDKGAYILQDEKSFDLILIASGSELNLALESAKLLKSNGINARVVSMPSWELFEKQDEDYRDSVIPKNFENKVSIEAGLTLGWEKYTGEKGLKIGIDHFGQSAPYKLLGEKLGFTPEKISEAIYKHFNL